MMMSPGLEFTMTSWTPGTLLAWSMFRTAWSRPSRGIGSIIAPAAVGRWLGIVKGSPSAKRSILGWMSSPRT